MERDSWTSTYDRDLDVPTRAPIDPTEPIDPYRRLVVNPLLPVATVIGAILILRTSLQSLNLTAFLTAIGLFCVSVFLVQLHCMDCGETTWLFSSRRHVCAPVLARWREGRPGRWPFPSPRTQIFLWVHVLASIAVLLLILFVLSR